MATMTATVVISLDPQGETATVRLGEYLGGARFEAFRAACSAAGARYVPAERVNRVPLGMVPHLMRALVEAGLGAAVDEALAGRLAEEASRAQALLDEGKARLVAADARLQEAGLRLHPYQRTGVEWLAPRRRAILADEMGLGKTVQALVSLPERAAALVVVPAAVRSVWEAECRRWRPDLRPTQAGSASTFRWPSPGELVIATYGGLPEDPTQLPAPETGTVLLADEAHALKNPRAQRTKRFAALTEQVDAARGRVLLVTGTPLLNRPPELWSLLKLAGLADEAYGGWGGFCRAFRAVKGKYGYAWGEPSAEAADRLRKVALRRRRTEVLPQLPRKTRRDVVVPVTAEAARACDAVLALLGPDAVLSLRPGMPGFEEISRARAALATAKIPAALEIAEDYEDAGEPLVAFSTHLAPVQALAAREGWAAITGETSAEERGRIVAEFQAGRLKGVAGTIGAMGVGVTLTRASHLLMIGLDWTPALNSQAEDRVCRIGQDRGVLVTRLIGDHDLDARVVELLTEKQELIEATVEASAVPEGYLGTSPAEELARAAAAAAESVADLRRLEEERAKQRAVEAEEQRRKVLAEVEGHDGREVEVRGRRRTAANATEDWAERALRILAEADPDHARERNEAGFNRLDGEVGHSLASELPHLTSKQWALAIRIASRYPRQVGARP